MDLTNVLTKAVHVSKRFQNDEIKKQLNKTAIETQFGRTGSHLLPSKDAAATVVSSPAK